MAEREGTPEDFARMAAEMRGQDIPSKAQRNRALVEAIHPEPEPDEPKPEPDETKTPEQAHNELISGLFARRDGKPTWSAACMERGRSDVGGDDLSLRIPLLHRYGIHPDTDRRP